MEDSVYDLLKCCECNAEAHLISVQTPIPEYPLDTAGLHALAPEANSFVSCSIEDAIEASSHTKIWKWKTPANFSLGLVDG